jgi:stearoyl-CoA desaturase (Delta-9 desaturase)
MSELPISKPPLVKRILTGIRQWFDSDYFPGGPEAARAKPDRFEWPRAIPFIFIHIGFLFLPLVGWSWTAVGVAVALYFVRMFAITGFYHRYFSHRTFQTSRFMQFVFAAWGNLAIQRGALWWAALHRHHHKHSDDEHDAHSPRQRGFWWSHIGWMTTSKNFPTDYSTIKDLAKFPELVFLNRFDLIVPALMGISLWALGSFINYMWPALGTSGAQMFVWGFFISTAVLLHGTLFINSLAHVWGKKRFNTEDDSRNSLLLALITLGEGWHNNHHRYMASARQGFYWWEIDITYYVLKMFSWMGLIWDLKPVPKSVYLEVEQSAGK